MKTIDFIRAHNACQSGAEWALSISADMSAVWDALVEQNRHEWLLWAATRPGVFPDSVMRKLACRFVRETPIGRETVWDKLTDDRSRKAVYVAEAYADGKATADELSDAYAAARDAALAADADAHTERAAYFAARAAADAAYSAAYAANADACAAGATDAARVGCATYAAYDAAASAAAAAAWAVDAAGAAFYNARADAKSAQVQMIAELGNPFKKGADK